MQKTLVVVYPAPGIDTTTTLFGDSPTITTFTNRTYSTVIATVLTQSELLSTTILSTGGSVSATSIITNSTWEVGPTPVTTVLSLLQLPTSTTPTQSSTNHTSAASQTSASRSSASARPSGSSSSAITPSDIAGAAVGCLVGGALIAGLVVWLFMSSRHKKQRSRGGFAKDRHSTGNVSREKSLPIAPSLAGAGWEQHLPQSESDGTIRTSVKALFDHIELHVENFYRNAAVSISPEIQSQLMQVDLSHLPDSVVGLLPPTKTPTMLIKHCLAALIVSRVTPETDTTASFLPADFVALPLAMGSTQTNANKPGKHTNCQKVRHPLKLILG